MDGSVFSSREFKIDSVSRLDEIKPPCHSKCNYIYYPHVFFETWGIPICKIIVKESRTRLKQVSKSEFAWLYENFFRKMKDKCWTKTCVGKKNSKRGKY